MVAAAGRERGDHYRAEQAAPPDDDRIGAAGRRGAVVAHRPPSPSPTSLTTRYIPG
jgi:hypothetical protein